MANEILTDTLIARETSLILASKLGFAATINRGYDDRFANMEAQSGDEFSVRIPPRYIVTKGEAMPATPQDSKETKRTLKITYDHVALVFKETELLLHINNFSNQFLKSAVAALANTIDLEGTKLYQNVANIVGTIGGGAPTELSTYLAADAILTEEGTPPDQRSVCINANMNEKIINSLKGLFHDSAEISEQYKSAKMRQAAGLGWMRDQNMYLHTTGTRLHSTTPLVDGAPTSGDSEITIDAVTNGHTLKVGDTFQIANVYAVNPQSRQSTGRLRSFLVTADNLAAGSQFTDIQIFPAIVSAGKDQTVDSLPADNAAVTFNGATASLVGHQGLAYHPDAFALAMVDDRLPDGVDFAAKTSPIDAQDWNVSISIIRDYDISKHVLPCRIGAYYGWLCARPEMACRVTT